MPSVHHVDSPVPATSVLVDLRNFTPNLNAAKHQPGGTNRFCEFLGSFYAAALDACMLALPPSERDPPTLSVNGTGDGLLVVFLGERHYANGLLAAYLLEAGLRRCCERREDTSGQLPVVSFGVGVESGEVSRVTAGDGPASVNTFIGHCVNVSARIESLTKLVSRANVIVGDATVEMCATAFYGVNFAQLRAQEAAAATDADRVALQQLMNDMNRDFCLTFLDRYTLKGVDDPLPLYRLDSEAAGLGVERFETLLGRLVDADDDHLWQVRNYLRPGGKA